MAYTVKQVAEMSGISARALRFYDETGLLAPAYLGANGYRFYEEPQLLTLQQILFYRELGIELRQIRRILGHADFERAAALRSHRRALHAQLARTRRLIETIDRTLGHLDGTAAIPEEAMFAGFRVAAGEDRFGARTALGGEPNDCKVSARDTDGALCVFEFTGNRGGPRHLHQEQDEWIYVLDGELECHVGDQRYRLRRGESVFVPRGVPHVWAGVGAEPSTILNAYQPAGRIEEFFRAVGDFAGTSPHEALSVDAMHRWFHAHGMELLGPPLAWSG